MLWANFLHFYQPPTQKKYWVDRVTSESYRPLVEGLLANPNIRLTLNVNTVLCDLWVQYGHQDVIDGIKTLVQRGQVELTGSAKFHPLLPKMPKEEIKRQIMLNEEGLQKYFGINRPKGFFPPEMAYDRYVAEVVAEMGYEWILAEELSYSQKLGTVKNDRIYTVRGVDPGLRRDDSLMVFFRERGFSWRILSGQLGTPRIFLTNLGERVNNNEYLLTAMDGETFGHHRPGMERQLFDIYNHSGVKSVTISELPKLFTKREETETLPSTWALMESEVMKNEPFSRWCDPKNEIHQLQWELTNLAISAVTPASVVIPVKTGIQNSDGSRVKHGMTQDARQLLDRALHSDQYWWASARPWWSLEMIERGAYELLSAVGATFTTPSGSEEKGLMNQAPTGKPSVLAQAQELYYKIITTGFEWQRSGKVDEMAKVEDESVRMLTDKGMASLPAEELDKMIGTIKLELAEVVKKEEFERAIQLRDRIRELENYKTR